MATICQFNQYGHSKFADSCDKIHNSLTCDSFPCLDNPCPKHHYYMYQRCRFAEMLLLSI